MTKYTVLQLHENGMWDEQGVVDASGSEQAIRRIAKDGTGQYVAVPARSWKPVQVAVKQRDPIITITPIT